MLPQFPHHLISWHARPRALTSTPLRYFLPSADLASLNPRYPTPRVESHVGATFPLGGGGGGLVPNIHVMFSHHVSARFHVASHFVDMLTLNFHEQFKFKQGTTHERN